MSEYSGHLNKYAGGEITRLSERTNRNGHKTVRADIQKGNRNPLNLEFSMYQNGSSWKIYNMKVEGFLLSRHFRSEFSRIMDQKGGLDGLISHLERRASLDNDTNIELAEIQSFSYSSEIG